MISTGLSAVRAPFHSSALCIWLISAVLPSFLTSNPIYLGVALGLVGWTHRQVASRSPTARAWGSFARFALFFVVFTLIFNVLMGGAGSTVLLELPAWTVTHDDGAVLFRIGGPVTLESLVFAGVRALALLLVIYALATFNTLTDHAQLLRGLPRWLDQAATVISIAIAFMPQLVAAQRDIREALALRGHRIRKLRDFVPLMLIMLSEALERAMALAESMEARGYSGPPMDASRRHIPRILIAGGLLLIGVGSVSEDLASAADLFAPGSWAIEYGPRAVLVLGAAMIALALRSIGGRGRRSRYRRELWRPRDTGLVLLSLIAGTALVILYAVDKMPFFYPVFPQLKAPVADYRILLPLLAILGPLIFHPAVPAAQSASPEESDRSMS